MRKSKGKKANKPREPKKDHGKVKNGFTSINGMEAPEGGWKLLKLCSSVASLTSLNLKVLGEPVSLGDNLKTLLDTFKTKTISDNIREMHSLYRSDGDLFHGLPSKPKFPAVLQFVVTKEVDETILPKTPGYAQKLGALKEMFNSAENYVINPGNSATVRQHLKFYYEQIRKAVLELREQVGANRSKIVSEDVVLTKIAKSTGVPKGATEDKENYFKSIVQKSKTDASVLNLKETRSHVLPLMVMEALEDPKMRALPSYQLVWHLAEMLGHKDSIQFILEPTQEMKEYIKKGKAMLKKKKEQQVTPRQPTKTHSASAYKPNMSSHFHLVSMDMNSDDEFE